MRTSKPIRAIFTGTESISSPEFSAIADSEIEFIHIPMLMFKQVPVLAEVPQNPDIIIFTSKNAVRFYFISIGTKTIISGTTQIVAIGDKTAAELRSNGIMQIETASENTAEGILKELDSHSVRGKVILIPASNLSDNHLAEELKLRGAGVYKVIVYETRQPEKSDLDFDGFKKSATSADLYMFTSPSTFSNFLAYFGISEPTRYFFCKRIGVIGETTAAAVREAGLTHDIIPENSNLKSFIDAVKNFYEKERSNT